MHRGSHLDESLDRHSESLAVSRKQNERIKQAGCRRSQQRTHRHSFHRVSSALHMMQTVQNSRRHHEGTAEDKVGQISHSGRKGSFGYQMYQNLHQLDHNSRHRSHGKTSYQNRDLREIQLIEGRSQEGNGEFQIHQYAGHRSQHRDLGDRPRPAPVHRISISQYLFTHNCPLLFEKFSYKRKFLQKENPREYSRGNEH